MRHARYSDHQGLFTVTHATIVYCDLTTIVCGLAHVLGLGTTSKILQSKHLPCRYFYLFIGSLFLLITNTIILCILRFFSYYYYYSDIIDNDDPISNTFEQNFIPIGIAAFAFLVIFIFAYTNIVFVICVDSILLSHLFTFKKHNNSGISEKDL